MTHDTESYRAYLSLALQALIPITLGSFKSLKTPASTIARRKKAAESANKILTEDEEDDLDDQGNIDEVLGWADSLAFPILGSIALLTLWALLKYVGKEWINLILGLYFSGAGVFAFQSTFSTIIRYLIRKTSYKPPTYHVRITSNLKQIFHLSLSLPSLILLPFSIILPLLYIPLDRPYILSNVLASCLATTTLGLLKLDSFFTAFLLLGLLLIYDIFWVFATPVMLTVAKGIDAPIKILAPKTFSPSPVDFAMLGLGDIVVPGLIIALCLRFDLHRHVVAHPKADITKYSPFGRVYFVWGVMSYIVGLAVTVVVMHTTKRAQPALLYLSPACTLGPVLLALMRGEMSTLRSFNDTPSEDNINTSKILDESIEPPSEAAMKAREAVKHDTVEEMAQQVVDHVEEDDEWMQGGGVVNGEEPKARKRKGGKKK